MAYGAVTEGSKEGSQETEEQEEVITAMSEKTTGAVRFPCFFAGLGQDEVVSIELIF